MNPDNTFFTADTHFGHKAMLRFGRPFENVDAMDEAVIAAWNRVVPPDGFVYHLGDVSFRRTEETIALLKRLNGHIGLIEGNHDRGMTGRVRDCFQWVVNSDEIYIEKQKIVICHYAFESWNKMQYGAWHLHGHSHGNLPPLGKRFDVGVDCSANFAPVSYRFLEECMALRPIQARDHHQPK